MKLYIGCGLTQAPQSFRDFVEEFKRHLKAEGHEILEFIGLVNGTPVDVWNHDINNVRTCDALIAIVDEPSIGLGIELNEAIRLGKPILCLHKMGQRITRMLMGARDLCLLKLEAYVDVGDAASAVSFFLANASVRQAAE